MNWRSILRKTENNRYHNQALESVKHRLKPNRQRSLDLGNFSSTHSTTALSGGCRYKPTSLTLVSSSGSVENLNPRVRCGARQNRCHTRMTEAWLTGSWPLRRSQSASRRDDQCVISCA